MARILAVSGIISLPFGFGAVGAQANFVTGGLFLALGPGILWDESIEQAAEA